MFYVLFWGLWMLFASLDIVSAYLPDYYVDRIYKITLVVEFPSIWSIFSIIIGIDDVSRVINACLIFSAICLTYFSSGVSS